MLMTKAATIVFVGAVVALVVTSTTVTAHHSHAMFNGSKETEITGVLSSVRFANPHVYLQVQATQRDGTPLEPKQTWAIEMSTTANMMQRGITRDILKVGAPISVKVNPLFSGGFSGNYTSMVMLDGVKNSASGQDWKPAAATP
jgi:Family of unknown function (DUF6152)